MKMIPLILGTALTSLLLGCATTRVAVAPVGPNPAGSITPMANGQLEVFSAERARRDGNELDPNPVWFQHADYDVFNQQGKWIEHVFNTMGHYAEAPRVIQLPVGSYVVKAQASGYLRLAVPVVIEQGRTTRVHLDASWKPLDQHSEDGIGASPRGLLRGLARQPDQRPGHQSGSVLIESLSETKSGLSQNSPRRRARFVIFRQALKPRKPGDDSARFKQS